MTTTKVKFRVFVTRRCRVCKKVHPMPTHRNLFHQGEEDPHDVIQQGHINATTLLNKENERAERFDQISRKNGKGKTRTNLNQRPYYQYHLEI